MTNQRHSFEILKAEGYYTLRYNGQVVDHFLTAQAVGYGIERCKACIAELDRESGMSLRTPSLEDETSTDISDMVINPS